MQAQRTSVSNDCLQGNLWKSANTLIIQGPPPLRRPWQMCRHTYIMSKYRSRTRAAKDALWNIMGDFQNNGEEVKVSVKPAWTRTWVLLIYLSIWMNCCIQNQGCLSSQSPSFQCLFSYFGNGASSPHA